MTINLFETCPKCGGNVIDEDIHGRTLVCVRCNPWNPETIEETKKLPDENTIDVVLLANGQYGVPNT
ncbi:MAG: hypothetical protein ACHQU0_00145 [Candidatus Paceibacteria bacterium]